MSYKAYLTPAYHEKYAERKRYKDRLAFHKRRQSDDVGLMTMLETNIARLDKEIEEARLNCSTSSR